VKPRSKCAQTQSALYNQPACIFRFLPAAALQASAEPCSSCSPMELSCPPFCTHPSFIASWPHAALQNGGRRFWILPGKWAAWSFCTAAKRRNTIQERLQARDCCKSRALVPWLHKAPTWDTDLGIQCVRATLGPAALSVACPTIGLSRRLLIIKRRYSSPYSFYN
jgi:hypothetical protein